LETDNRYCLQRGLLENKTDNSVSKTAAWILAVRPKTLPAALAPVVVGSALAFAHHRFKVLPATAALTVALLLQVGVNLANDYFDYVKGVLASGPAFNRLLATTARLAPVFSLLLSAAIILSMQ